MTQPHVNTLATSLRRRASLPVSPVPLPVDPQTRTWSASTDLYAYINERGFFYPREVVSRYLLSLKSKPFVLFSGISGTGKTKLALLTAEYYAHSPGTTAHRLERPRDNDSTFYIPIDKVTLRSGTLTPHREQFDYFNVEAGQSSTVTVNITNLLGAQGDITFRAHNMIYGGRKHLSISAPISVRRAFEETGVTENDYLKFEIVEEFKRYRVSLFRPEREQVEELPEHRYAFVSVRPSWRDHTALLGHYDDELERYYRTTVLELLLRARREEQEAARLGRTPAPYFIVLDEMNIAKIEHYFSDFLSVMESRRYDADGTIRQESLNLHNADAVRLTWIDDQGVEYEIPPNLPIPNNVLITGTVNDDDTTFGVSPKVLDRASTIEFSAVDFNAFLGLDGVELAPSVFEISEADTKTLQLGELELSSQDESQRLRRELEPLLTMNSVLASINQHFGYRVLNDTALFVRNAQKLIGNTPEVVQAALDVQILQKVLPKLFNIRDDRNGVFATLLYLCCAGELPECVPDRETLLRAFSVDASDHASYDPGLLAVSIDADASGVPDGRIEAWFPRSAGKLCRMLSHVE